MSITKQVYCGTYTAPDSGVMSPFEVTCRLVRSSSGLESMHIIGWVAVDGVQSPVSKTGITLPGESMHGKERAIAMAHIADCVRTQTRS